MTKKAECAHCGDGATFPGSTPSFDDRRRVRCGACDELVCQKCKAASSDQECRHWSDPVEPEPEEVEPEEALA